MLPVRHAEGRDVKLVLLKDLASELGMDRSLLHKQVRKAGITTHKVRPPGSRGMVAFAVSGEDAELLRARNAWRLGS